MWRRVAGRPQSGQAGSTSFCPHRRKLSGVGRVFEIALRLNRSSPSSKPWIRRRQERSECMASVHSNHRPWTANCLSLDSWLSVSISAMMLRMRLRREAGSRNVVWVVVVVVVSVYPHRLLAFSQNVRPGEGSVPTGPTTGKLQSLMTSRAEKGTQDLMR